MELRRIRQAERFSCCVTTRRDGRPPSTGRAPPPHVRAAETGSTVPLRSLLREIGGCSRFAAAIDYLTQASKRLGKLPVQDCREADFPRNEPRWCRLFSAAARGLLAVLHSCGPSAASGAGSQIPFGWQLQSAPANGQGEEKAMRREETGRDASWMPSSIKMRVGLWGELRALRDSPREGSKRGILNPRPHPVIRFERR